MTRFSLLSLLTFFTVTLTSCEAIKGIFKAGMWTGIIVVIAVVALIMWLIGRGRK